MRFVAIAVILLSIPLFISLLRQHPQRRSWAMVGIGLMLFIGGTIRIDATVYGWPLWAGLYKSAELTPVDSLAIALILTRSGRSLRQPFLGLFVPYGLALMFSVLFATVPMASMFSWWHYGRLVLLFVAFAGEIARPDMRRGLFNGLSLGLMLQAVYVIQQKASGVVQATGTMYHQNTLGIMIEMAMLPLGAALLAGERSRLMQIGVAAGLIVVVGGGSRGTLVLVGGGIALLTVLSLIRQVTPTKLRIVGLGVLAMVVVTPLGLMTLKERFGTHSVITEESERAAFERAARAMAADHPFGVGPNMYVPTANALGYAQRAGVSWNFANRSAPVHNAYLLARAETGWFGQFAYMLLLFVPMVAGLRFAFKRRQGPEGDLVLGATVALGALAVHDLYEFAGLAYGVLAIASVSISLIAALPQVRSVVRRRPRPKEADRLAVEASQPLATP